MGFLITLNSFNKGLSSLYPLQISKLKQKHKENEKLVGVKDGLERKVTDLQAEVDKLGGVVSGLKKKMKEGNAFFPFPPPTLFTFLQRRYFAQTLTNPTNLILAA